MRAATDATKLPDNRAERAAWRRSRDAYARGNTTGALRHAEEALALRAGEDPEVSATPSLESGGITPKRSESMGNPDWRADMEHVWRSRMGFRIAALDARASAHAAAARALAPFAEHGTEDEQDEATRRVLVHRAAERWASDRARSAAMTRADVVDSCGGRFRCIACGCGWRDVEVGCEQPQLCATCRTKHARQHRRRLTRALDAHLRGARGAWARERHGMLPGLYMVTLTGPHSGDLVRDRTVMGRAVKRLVDHGTRFGWWSAYVLTWEVTGGDDGKGHVHAHLVAVSSWIPYSSNEADVTTVRRKGERRGHLGIEYGLHQVWRASMPGALVLDVSAPTRKKREVADAAYYLSKYVTKGIDHKAMSGAKAGECLVAFYCRRKYTASRYFWRPLRDRVPRCPCCDKAYRLVGQPPGLQQHAPAAVLRSRGVRFGVRNPSETEQKSLWPP